MRDLQPEHGTRSAACRPTSRAGLDWFTFFVADLQTGFGPFLSVYLTTQKWTQVDIGLVLSVGSIASLLGQIPGGWLVDAARSKLRIAGAAVICVGVSALFIGLAPGFLTVFAAELLHVAASCILGPAMAAISLGLVGHAAIGPRLGRNARFAATGSCLAAGFMGACGYFVSAQAVFFVTAVLALPALLALSHIREADVDPVRAGGEINAQQNGSMPGVVHLLGKPPLLILMGCLLFFHLANAAMLPLVGSSVTMQSGAWATALVATCIVGPQLVVVAISPTIGALAQGWGRRPLLLIGFAALPVRGALLAWTSDPYLIVAVQLLDGISAASLGVLVPLMLADIARGTGHFNLAQGIAGCATGIGAAGSAVGAGYLADRHGISAAFMGLAGMALCAFLLLFTTMPETKPSSR